MNSSFTCIRRVVLLQLILPAALLYGQQIAPLDSASVLDLHTLVQAAITHNPALRASRLEANALVTRRRQVSVLPDPTVMMFSSIFR